MLIADVYIKDGAISQEDADAIKTTLAYTTFGDDAVHKSFAELETFISSQITQVAEYVNTHARESYKLSGMYVLLRHAQLAIGKVLDKDVREVAPNVMVVYMTMKCAYDMAQDMLQEPLKSDPRTPHMLAVIMSISISLRYLMEAMRP